MRKPRSRRTDSRIEKVVGTVNTSTAPSSPVYFSMTGAAAVFRHRVQVAPDRGPGVVPVLLVVRGGVERDERRLGGGFDVGDVLLVQDDVVPGAQPAQVSGDEVLPGVGQGLGGGLHPAGHVLTQVDAVEGHPAGEHDVDEHEGVVVREVDVDVVGRVVAPVPRQLDTFAADLEGPLIGKGLFRRRLGLVVIPQQEPPALFVADAGHAGPENGGRTGVVGVVVRVDEVGDLVAHALGGGDFVHGPLQVVAEGRRGVEQHDAVPGGQEGRVVVAVGDPVQVPLDASHVITLVVEGWAEGRPRDGHVVGQDGRPGGAGGL